MNPAKIAVIAIVQASGEKGGAERFYDGLVAALNRFNVHAELISVLSDESCFETIEEAYLRCYDLDLSGYDGVISTKAPAYLVKHPNHICYLQHTMRVFYDMFDTEFPAPTSELIRQREFIQMLDTAALRYPKTKKVFVIGEQVKARLLKYNHIDSEVLYQGLGFDAFKCGSYEYIFMPGRLHRWKRVDLVIQAMRYVDRPLCLKIAGTGEDERRFVKLAKTDRRIEFCGRVSEEELVELYSNALVVPFVPIREDFGLITLEAFRSFKPVITCEDSGEPAHIVRQNETGFICPPDPKAIASKIEYLYDHPDIAKRMGLLGEESIKHIRWEETATILLSVLGMSNTLQNTSPPEKNRVKKIINNISRYSLFPSSDCYTLQEPAEAGFYDLEMPDSFRWISNEATFQLPLNDINHYSRPALMVTASNDLLKKLSSLTVCVNNISLGTQVVPRYGNYYYHIDLRRFSLVDSISITLKVDKVQEVQEGMKTRQLGLPIYDVRLIDLDKDSEKFQERSLFYDQVKVFRPNECCLDEILKKKYFDSRSLILDIGAGMGWTTGLLAASTGARAIGVDIDSYYTEPSISIKSELIHRFSRHFTVLRKEPSFEKFQDFKELEQIIQENCAFLSLNAQAMSFRDELFDFVFSLNAFEHIFDPSRALSEIGRILKKGGEAFIIFSPIYYCDGGHHLHACGLLAKPWVHLLYDRAEIKRLIVEAGKVPNEMDNILNSLNGWSVKQYMDIFKKSKLKIITKEIYSGFTIPGAEKSGEFERLKITYSLEDLMTVGMMVHLIKNG